MKNLFSISKTAKMVDMTTETLRHYDRIGLVKPSHKDEVNGYRYYGPQDIVRLNTIQALQYMDLTLNKIKELLEYNQLEKIIDMLSQAEKNADNKIVQLKYAKAKIKRAREDYEKKLHTQNNNQEDVYIKDLPERIILLSDTLKNPTLDNLWDYHSHFYKQVEPSKRELYSFEDLAGIYDDGNQSQLFAICIQHPKSKELKVLPKGKYLCGNCQEENRKEILDQLMQIAFQEYGVKPDFSIHLIIISGILQWSYQIQILIE